MFAFRYVAVFAVLAVATAQEYEFSSNPRPAPARVQPGYSGPSAPKPTPVAILKQINRHNEDGSYTYGYEGADGSFKIETKNPTGEVKGKYGYVDDTGKVRVVEYGATKYGFEPSGEGITVAPPTLVDESTDKNGLAIQYDDEPRQGPQAVQRPVYRPAPIQYNPPAPQRTASPVPQRLQIAGASPVGPSASFEFGSAPAPVRSYSPGPAITRPQLSLSAYASPAPIEEDSYEAPTPSPKVTYAQPRPQPAYQFAQSPASTQAITRPQFQQQQYQPAPQQYQPAPQPKYQPAPQQYQPRPAQSGRSGGVLDQLAKDYALPSNAGAPLHDISFGYY